MIFKHVSSTTTTISMHSHSHTHTQIIQNTRESALAIMTFDRVHSSLVQSLCFLSLNSKIFTFVSFVHSTIWTCSHHHFFFTFSYSTHPFVNSQNWATEWHLFEHMTKWIWTKTRFFSNVALTRCFSTLFCPPFRLFFSCVCVCDGQKTLGAHFLTSDCFMTKSGRYHQISDYLNAWSKLFVRVFFFHFVFLAWSRF